METQNSSQHESKNQMMPPEEVKIGKKFIHTRTIILIIVLAAFAVFFSFLALNAKRTNPSLALPSPTPTPAYIKSILSLIPASQGQTTTTRIYNVTIDSDINTINAIQVELAFDPKAISNITISPGTFFTHPVILLKNVDYKNGRISYALGIQPTDTGIKGKGTIAILSFQISQNIASTGTTLSFLPKTFVAAQGITPSVLKEAKNVVVPVSLPPSTTTP
jgi:hypothetical protein